MVIECKVSRIIGRQCKQWEARLDPQLNEEIQVASGGMIKITHQTETAMYQAAAILLEPKLDDGGKNAIYLSGYLRRKLHVRIGDKVEIEEHSPQLATRVTLAPIDEIDEAQTFGEYGSYIISRLHGMIVNKNQVLNIPIFTGEIRYVIINIEPKDEIFVQINRGTRFVFVTTRVDPNTLEDINKGITYDDIGGLETAIMKIREMVELPIRHMDLFKKIGIMPPKGVLLYGPPGTGKTLLAKAVANECDAFFTSISGPEIMDRFYGQSEKNLRNIFEEAKDKAKAKEMGHSIIFIDEIDGLAPKRGERTGEGENRIVAQLLSLMDGIKERGEVIVLAATNKLEMLDEALRRPGRFDREIEIGVPDKNGRLEVLEIHTRGMPLADDVDLGWICDNTNGFVGADLESLCKEAGMTALRRILPSLDLDQRMIPIEALEHVQVTNEDFKKALNDVNPSLLREVSFTIPSETWKDIGGLDKEIQTLRETIEWPLKYPQYYKQRRDKLPKGVIVFGPPGTGKTLIAKALAHSSGCNFIYIKGPELISKWVGESERGIREIFHKARNAAPCIIFFDEIDAIAPVRGQDVSRVSDRVVAQLLTEMAGITPLREVFIIAATNRLDQIDPALLRSGRFGVKIKLPEPSPEAREAILRIHLKGLPLEDITIDELVVNTSGFNGADLEALVSQAYMDRIRSLIHETEEEGQEVPEEITLKRENIDKALDLVKKSKDPNNEACLEPV